MMRRWLNNQKLYKKILFIVLGACVLLLSGWIIVWQIVVNVYNEVIYDKTAQVFISCAENIETKLDKLETVTLSLIADAGIQDNLVFLKNSDRIDEQWLRRSTDLAVKLRSHMNDFSDLVGVRIYAESKSTSDATWGDDMLLSAKSVEELKEVAAQKNGRMEIVVHQKKIYLVRQIRKIEKLSLDCLGTIIGELDIQTMVEDSCKAYVSSGLALNVFLYAEEECIYGNDKGIQPLSQDGWEIRDGYFIAQCTSGRGWQYLFCTPYDQILSTFRITITMVIILSVIIMLFILIISGMLLNKVFQKLDELVVRFDAYAKGTLPSREEMMEYQERLDEIGYLNRQFERMVYAHKQLEDENYQRMLLFKDAQFKQLQHQIRPHFIFNTLSMISWTAYKNQDTEAAQLCKALSEMLRGSMSTDGEIVTLEKEIKLIEYYIYILQIRYRDKIEFVMELPEDLLQIRIPYMTMQPIVENAVNYGLEEDLDICNIRIWGTREGNKVVLIVEDNGPGIEPDIIEKLVSGEKKPNGNGVSLLNVQKRIQLAFSEEYGLSFHRVDGHTQVRITVPYGIEDF